MSAIESVWGVGTGAANPSANRSVGQSASRSSCSSGRSSGRSGGRSGNVLATLLGAVLALGLVAGAGACSDDNDPDPMPDPDGGVVDPPEPTNSAVLVAERVFTPQGQRFYYVSMHAAVPTAAIDRSKALELTSADIEVYGNRVFIRDRDANTITRYKVTAALALEQDGDKINFSGVGLGTGRYHNAYVNPELAYTLDSGAWRMIGWNPKTMRLTGKIISIDSMRKPQLPGGAIGPPVKVGSRIIAPIYWADFTNLVYFPGSGALVIDPNSPSQPVFIEDPRVGGAFRITDGADGHAYSTGVVGGEVHLFGRASGGGALPTSGLVRIPDGQNTFDGNYLVDIEDITNSPGVWAIHRLDATHVLAQVYDPAVAPPATLAEYNNSVQFIYVLVDTAAKTFTQVAALPKSGRGNAGNHVVDGKLYIQQSGATGSVSYAATTAGEITQAFPIPAGDVWHLQRIR